MASTKDLISSRTIGVADLIANLKAAGVEITRSTERKALFAGARVIGTEARRRVSVREGALKRAIVWETRGQVVFKGKPRQYVAVVTVSKKAFTRGARGRLALVNRAKLGQKARYTKGQIYPRNYAHLVEFGTRPHSLGPGKGMHPGARPKPFLRPALDTKRAEATAEIARVLRAEGVKIAAKLAAKGRGQRRAA